LQTRFYVQCLHGDGQFEHIKKHFADEAVTINITGRNEHVPAIERTIHTIKERIWAMVNQLPFKAYPHRLIVEMMYNVMFWLNAFPHNDGVHDVMSPRTILTGLHIDHDKHCTLEFGTYVQIHEEHDNSMTSRTSGAIALRPTGNTQGTHYFLNINSGRRVARNHWTTLPMPNEVINAIHRLAAAYKKHKGIVFMDKNGNINSPEDADSTEITGVSTGVDNNSPKVADSTGVDNIGNTGNNTGNIHNNNIGNTDRNAVEMNMQDNMPETKEETYIGTNDGKEMTAQDGENIHELHGTEEHVPETYEEPTVHNEQIIEEMNTANYRHEPETENIEGHIANDVHIVTNHRYNLRPRPTKRHDRLNLMQVTQQSTWVDNEKPHMHVLMTQMSVKAGIKKFGKRGDDAVSKEL